MFLYLQNPEDISNIDRVSLYILLAIEILTSRQLITYEVILVNLGERIYRLTSVDCILRI